MAASTASAVATASAAATRTCGSGAASRSTAGTGTASGLTELSLSAGAAISARAHMKGNGIAERHRRVDADEGDAAACAYAGSTALTSATSGAGTATACSVGARGCLRPAAAAAALAGLAWRASVAGCWHETRGRKRADASAASTDPAIGTRPPRLAASETGAHCAVERCSRLPNPGIATVAHVTGTAVSSSPIRHRTPSSALPTGQR